MSDKPLPSPTDAVTLLIHDHRNVTTLWQYAQTQAADRAPLLDEIIRELSVHDGIEKQLLYPTVRNRVEGGSAMADRSLAEHQKVSELLAAAEKADLDSAEAFRLLAETMDNVAEHVAEEEAQMFPALTASLTHQELIDLGEQLQAAKLVAPTHPHPAAPNDGLAAKVVGLAAGIIDTAKDTVVGRPSDPDV
jgi:hemerythrin superfamily protein